ncbi:LysR family transcriptional regulator [Pseudotabrizicola formosa]|uniref:LysR family transcriptional regulator n=1 Tax=Pseudotabrizicola formosa TaxID=2030009 RepID=UPI000CD06230|nr:LysR family transcriptional regulator [Pseudotabrizicola formosa]
MKLSRSRIPDILALQSFEAAARHGSFTRAAEELSLTQSAVSRQIKDLEAQLGVALFERVRQRVVLSAAGLRLLPDASRVLSQVEMMTLRAAGTRDVTGHLSVATLPTFGSRWLVPRLPDFLAQHTGLQLTVTCRAESFDLNEAGVNVAIHYGQPVWPRASCTYLCAETVVPVASPLLAGQLDGSVLTAPLLHMDSRPMLWVDWLAATGDIRTDGMRGHRFDQFTLLIEAAMAGLGVALVPTYLVERELRDRSLQIVHNAPLRTDAAYYVVLPNDHVSDPLCSAFLGWIRSCVST